VPIRQRGSNWQVDVRLPDGRRYRKTVTTEDAAKQMEAALKTNPQQRRAMKLSASRQSPGATTGAPAPSVPPSENTQPNYGRVRSIQAISLISAPRLDPSATATSTSATQPCEDSWTRTDEAISPPESQS
jgi:hypothetical protein